MNFFKRRNYTVVSTEEPVKGAKEPETPKEEAPSVPDGLWLQCRSCKQPVYKRELDEYKICPKCGGYFRMTAWERVEILCDKDSFEQLDADMTSKNPMGYPSYDKIIKKAQEKGGLKDAVLSGTCSIGGFPCVLAIMDSHFMMGSMGSVVGEKLTRAVEYATDKRLPVLIFTTSGGARMQEGILSLMQMAKVSAAIRKHSDEGLLYVDVLTDPTTGGVTASFAMLGDIILAEPNALVGFAGQRVIKNTIKQDLPEGFQTAQFQLEHGFVDKIVERQKLRETIALILKLHPTENGVSE